MILESQISEYFFNRLLENYSNDNNFSRKKLAAYRSIYSEFLKYLTKDEPQIFSSNFARSVFVFDKFEINEKIIRSLNRFREITHSLSSVQKTEISSSDLDFCFVSLCRFIGFFNESLIPESISSIIENVKVSDEIPEPDADLSTLEFVRLVVIRKNESYLICENEAGRLFNVKFQRKWADTLNYIWNGCVLNLFDFEEKTEGKIKYLINGTVSLVVLEPDYTIDVTDVSGCFTGNGPSVALYFLKRVSQSSLSMNLILGNVVNFCLDELLINPKSEFEDIYYKALSSRPLQILTLASKNKEEVGLLKVSAKVHFDNLKRIIPKIQTGEVSIEPSFISNKYGLQGRLDVMIEFQNDARRKNIIELKSGKSPNVDLTLSLPGNTRIKTGIWNENYAQTICYNLLLDSTFENRTGSTQILYSVDSAAPLRDAPNIIQKKQEILLTRNQIVAEEHAILNKNYKIFKSINPKDMDFLPDFKRNEVIKFHDVFISCDEIERKYFRAYFSFLMAENYAARLGTDNGRDDSGFSSLWKDSIEEKETSMNVISGLTLNYSLSDFEKYHLSFNRTKSGEISSIRKGDLAILYPISKDGESLILKNQIIKCHIVDIEGDMIRVSLRNKLLRRSFLEEFPEWVLEQDYVDSTSKILQTFFSFLQAPERKRQLIMGIAEPVFSKKVEYDVPELNEKQRYILSQALAAQDYFIIQGPPGTGKTSYMLKEIVNQIFNSSEESILVLAYTNRAVDEICSALKKIDEDFPFLRLGNKESSEYKDNLISCLAETLELKELYKKMRTTRVYVSTVSSILTNPEIFEIKKFNTVIIDEASQILEPYLVGILTKVDRFILIGDEKQLPSIVLQSAKKIEETDPQLNGIGLNSLGSSLFERLLKECNKNQYHFAYAMLNEQARMHSNIQAVANNLFYDDKLRTINAWQNSDSKLYYDESKDIDKILTKSRILFIPSKNEYRAKVNQSEVLLTIDLINRIKEHTGNGFNDSSVGVISPFRAQCAEIIKALPDEFRSIVSVDTVERFQGSERDVIIISYATNHAFLLSNIQSLVEIDGKQVDRKLNVAITRARNQLIILGNPSVLASSPIFNKLIYIIRQNGGYVETEELNLK